MVSANTTSKVITSDPSAKVYHSPEELDRKVTQLAEWVMQSQ